MQAMERCVFSAYSLLRFKPRASAHDKPYHSSRDMNDMKKDSFVISRPKFITRSGRLYMLILLKHLKMVGSREFRWKEGKESIFCNPGTYTRMMGISTYEMDKANQHAQAALTAGIFLHRKSLDRKKYSVTNRSSGRLKRTLGFLSAKQVHRE